MHADPRREPLPFTPSQELIELFAENPTYSCDIALNPGATLLADWIQQAHPYTKQQLANIGLLGLAVLFNHNNAAALAITSTAFDVLKSIPSLLTFMKAAGGHTPTPGEYAMPEEHEHPGRPFTPNQKLLTELNAQQCAWGNAKLTPAVRLALDWLKDKHPYTTNQLVNAAIIGIAATETDDSKKTGDYLEVLVPMAYDLGGTIAFLQNPAFDPTPPAPTDAADDVDDEHPEAY